MRWNNFFLKILTWKIWVKFVSNTSITPYNVIGSLLVHMKVATNMRQYECLFETQVISKSLRIDRWTVKVLTELLLSWVVLLGFHKPLKLCYILWNMINVSIYIRQIHNFNSTLYIVEVMGYPNYTFAQSLNKYSLGFKCP